jgi:ribonuclease G
LLSFLRKLTKKAEGQAPQQAAAPVQTTPAPARPADQATPGGDAAAKPRRRRGTRGGRNRRKPTADPATAEGTAAAKTPAKQKPKPKADSPARKPEGADRKPAERKPAGAKGRSQSQSRRRIQPKRGALPEAKRELLVSVDVGEQRVAVLEDGRVAEVYLERPERRSIAGNIYLGVVDNVLPGMEAAFVEIGLEKNGFLYVDEIVVPELEGKRHGKRIQDLIARGQTILVQAVKDPMKTKGARLTTEISLPGRFVVFVPSGEGLGVSRRLPDEERARLKDIIKALDVPQGGIIVRTAAEGASAEDIERDLVFLQRLWKTIEARANETKAPTLIYQEAELPLRVIRDLFTGDFERALIDHERTYKRIVGYLKKTSPHMVERVVRDKEHEPLFERMGVEAEIKSTLSRRVDLPSGGYLIFDYAEAFTVIDVNTGRFVGSRSKTSGARLEDTITKNNLEAVGEVVRQLRLRDIGGIIVIDFIDMANPKNRATVEEALRTELERDRTKTYVVEISPLGLVEMTRQNVTDGPREILTRKCPTCGGDGVVLSDNSAAVDAERKLRALVTKGSRTQAYRVELHPRVASILVGPGGSRLAELEAQTRRRFFLETTDQRHGVDHLAVLAEGKVEDLQPKAPVSEGEERELKLVEVGLHDPGAAVGKVDGYDVCVAGAAKAVGKKARVRVERVLAGSAYATWLDAPGAAGAGAAPLTAEAEAEKPTRAPRARKATGDAAAAVEAAETETDELEPAAEDEVAAEVEVPGEGIEVVAADAGETAAAAKKRTRRGSRGGRGRKRTPAGAAGAPDELPTEVRADEPEAEAAVAEAPVARIHVPDETLGRDEEADDASPPVAEPLPADAEATEPSEEGAVGDTTPKKRTRRGTRGGRGRRKKPAEAGAGQESNGDAVAAVEAAETPPETPDDDGDAPPGRDGEDEWGYVPMSEWESDFSPDRSRR